MAVLRDRCVTGPMTVKSTKEVIEMNIPGFTAEASLFNVGTRYQATTEASFYGGIVQPASPFSDVFHPDRPVPVLYSHVFHPRPVFCLKRLSVIDHNGIPYPYYLAGIWNPVTGSCE